MEKRIKDNVKEWKCDKCKKWFRLDEEWDSKGSKEECELIWGVKPEDDMPAVCDDCWEKIHPSRHVGLYKQAREIVKKTGKLN
jgi:hypothetical protein